MKFLIAGLGNIGEEYRNTRHNIGFEVLDALTGASNLVYAPARYGDVARYKFKGRTFILLKPSTYMNLSGKAVNYWLQQEKIPMENLLVVTDDLNLPFGSIRLRAKGSDGGHNGLKNIQEILGTNQYSRLRFGIGDAFSKGKQINFVLGKWDELEQEHLSARIDLSIDIIKSFGTIGAARTMSAYNNKGKFDLGNA